MSAAVGGARRGDASSARSARTDNPPTTLSADSAMSRRCIEGERNTCDLATCGSPEVFAGCYKDSAHGRQSLDLRDSSRRRAGRLEDGPPQVWISKSLEP